MKIVSILLGAVALLILSAGCVTKGARFDPRASDSETNSVHGAFEPLRLTNRLDSTWLQPPLAPFRLGPGDVVEIDVLGEGGGRSQVSVGPDGRIYFSLLPGLQVWGLTLAETKELLEQEIARFSRIKPELVVVLRAVGSQRMWILGAVPKPGVYPLGTPSTLLEAISAAGGTPSINAVGDIAADLHNSFVMRDGRFLPIDFDRLINQGDMTQNIFLLPDDFVFVRPTSMPSVYVLGAVRGANIYPYNRELSVASALITAGGVVKYGLKSKVLIIRGGLTQPKIAEVDYDAIVRGRAQDILLAPGDIVYVPFSPFRKLAILAEDVLDQFVRTIAVNEGQKVIYPDADPIGLSVPGGRGIYTPPQ